MDQKSSKNRQTIEKIDQKLIKNRSFSVKNQSKIGQKSVKNRSFSVKNRSKTVFFGTFRDTPGPKKTLVPGHAHFPQRPSIAHVIDPPPKNLANYSSIKRWLKKRVKKRVKNRSKMGQNVTKILSKCSKNVTKNHQKIDQKNNKKTIKNRSKKQ